MPRARRRIPMATTPCFWRCCATLVDRYQGKEITNTDFEQAVEEVLPRSLWFENRKSLDWFFDGWVNGTAFPQLEVAGSEVRARLKGNFRQRRRPPEFSAL